MKNSKEEGTSYGQTGRKADKQTGKGRVGDGGGAEFFPTENVNRFTYLSTKN